MNTLELSRSDVLECKALVVEIMVILGFDVHIKELPEVRIVKSEDDDTLNRTEDGVKLGAYYNAIANRITISRDYESKIMVCLAHELTHSLQQVPESEFEVMYSERRSEIEAFSVQLLYPIARNKLGMRILKKYPKLLRAVVGGGVRGYLSVIAKGYEDSAYRAKRCNNALAKIGEEHIKLPWE